ncbi:hypothetical protein HK405_012034 [Cladochytrium tenue]|nr:hypothetical protein HK405_012034 [Cladochytrium tenue]
MVATAATAATGRGIFGDVEGAHAGAHPVQRCVRDITPKSCSRWHRQRAVDQKKEDFRKYLEKNGIIDALTKVLVGLYEEPEKPENPVDFIKQFLGGPSDVDVDALKRENEDLRRRVDELQAQVEQLSVNTSFSSI